MRRSDVPITTPCGADWNAMSPAGARARLCAQCDKTVHDLSAMKSAEVEALVAAGPLCVRYLYDVHGRILFDVPAGASIVPASALTSRAQRKRWAALAAVAVSAIVFEACGGASGGFGDVSANGGAPDGGRTVATPPAIGDDELDAGSSDAEADGDAGSEADGDADADDGG